MPDSGMQAQVSARTLHYALTTRSSLSLTWLMCPTSHLREPLQGRAELGVLAGAPPCTTLANRNRWELTGTGLWRLGSSVAALPCWVTASPRAA